MRFWFDTEFYEDGNTITLISIGVVADDGREYYAEVKGADLVASASPWLKENVLPHLRGAEAERYSSEMGRDLIAFMGEAPEIWAYYADYDWVVLCQLFGRMIDLPKGWPMYCRDLKQLMDDRGVPRDALPKQVVEHDALADARWTRDAWHAVMRHRPVMTPCLLANSGRPSPGCRTEVGSNMKLRGEQR